MLGPAGHGTLSTGEGDAAITAVRSSVDHVAIRPLDVERRLHQPGDDGVVGEVGGESTELLELAIGVRLLDRIPLLGAATGVVRIERHHLHGVGPLRAPARVDERGGGDQDPWVVVDEVAVRDLPGAGGHVVDPPGDAGRHRRAGAVVCGELGGDRGGEVGGEERHAYVIGLHSEGEVLAPGFPRRHVEQVLDMDRRDDRVPSPIILTALGPHTDAAAVFDDQLRDRGVAVDGGSMIGEEADQGVDETTRASGGDRPASRLPTGHDLISQQPGSGSVDRHCGLRRHEGHEGADVRILELVDDHVAGAHHHPAHPHVPPGMLGEQLLGAGPVPDRAESRGTDDRLHRVVLGEQPPIGLGVPLREPSDLFDRLVDVEPHRHRLAVGEGDDLHRIRIDIGEPVLLDQAQLVEPDERVHLDERVAGGAGVHPHAVDQHLLGGGTTARDRAGIDDGALVAGLGEVGGSDEAVVPGPGNDDVGGPGHPWPPMTWRTIQSWA